MKKLVAMIPAFIAPLLIVFPEVSFCKSNSCAKLNGSKFVSVGSYETGNSPNGPVMNKWSVRFNNNKFDWSRSDVAESGSFTCSNGVIQGKKWLTEEVVKGKIDKDKLLWDKIEYRKTKALP